MHSRRFVLGGLTLAVALLGGIAAALAFSPPGGPQSSPQPSPSVAAPGEPTPVTPATDKSITPSKTEPLVKPVAPLPHAINCIRPWTVDRYAWPNWLYYHQLSVVITVEKGSKEGEELVAVVQDLPPDYIGRVFFALEVVDASNPSIFDEPGGKPRKYGVMSLEHDEATHVSVMNEQWQDPTDRSWCDEAFRTKITKKDRKRNLTIDDLRPSQLAALSDASRTLWMKGRVDGESLRLWLDASVGQVDTKKDLKAGFARFRVLTEKNWLMLLGTRLRQPIIFVHAGDKDDRKLDEDESLAPAARLLATYCESHPWVVNADTTFGKNLHVFLSKDPKSSDPGVSPPADGASIICFQLKDEKSNPRGDKAHKGPYRLDPTKLAGELEKVLDNEVKLTRVRPATLLVTQQTAVVESAVPPKK